VRDVWRGLREDPGAATRDVTQIRNFFEADESITGIETLRGANKMTFGVVASI
jgi:hypothetical protein